MSEEEIKAYLMRWLMEFGDGPVPYSIIVHNRWYVSQTVSCAHSRLHPYLDCRFLDYLAQINQAGLDLIRGEP